MTNAISFHVVVYWKYENYDVIFFSTTDTYDVESDAIEQMNHVAKSQDIKELFQGLTDEDPGEALAVGVKKVVMTETGITDELIHTIRLLSS